MRKYFESTALLTLFLSMGLSGMALANPQDGVVSAGSATISSAGKKLDIHQGSQKVVIDWRSFNIAPDEHTQFYQPNSNAMALNRINSGNASQIMGKLTANGNVMIVNPSGVIFGKESQVDVNGLVAATSAISNADFMAGNLKFTPGGNANASITNNGTITAKEAGLVGLVAPQVNNSGTITAKLGKVQLASGDSFNVDMYGDGLINVAISDDVTKQIVSNSGAINAKGGLITMSAATGAQVVNNLINNDGTLDASSVSEQGGKIVIGGDAIMHTGTMDASGSTGGAITVMGRNVSQQGQIIADGKAGAGGNVAINYTNAYIDKEAGKVSAKATNGNGGTVTVAGTQSGSRAFVSGEYNVSSTTAKGGKAVITAKDGDLKLFGARVNADGKTGGGEILVGGDYQGTGTTAHARNTGVNFATKLSANATGNGKGGKVVVWSDKETLFGGSATAKGGTTGGNGGLIEISSKDTMKIAGNAKTDASAAYGAAGQLLLDPKNIIIATGGISGGGISSVEFIDPNMSSGNFGENSTVLDNGNVIIVDNKDDTYATDGGAVYLFNGTTGAVISSLYGGSAGDEIGTLSGYDPTMILEGNGNAVITSGFWDNATATDAGAVTFMNKNTGVSGLISSSNSLVGSSNDDAEDIYVDWLDNGNYVVLMKNWDNGVAVDAGAATWGSGTTGITGVVNPTISLVGTTSDDQVGTGLLRVGTGNYLIRSPEWTSAGQPRSGAVTWADGDTGIAGPVSAANSLVGSSTFDLVGWFYDEVGNGNVIIRNSNWNGRRGAVTWINGNTGLTGTINAGNSFVGTTANDEIGWSTTVLSNGNYVIYSPYWSNNGTLVEAGAHTWANGNAPITGTVSVANSLVGDKNDMTGWGNITELTNGNYIIRQGGWHDGTGTVMGAVTWASGTAPITGIVSAANSLVGSSTGDYVGGGFDSVIPLANGNYVVSSHYWSSGGFANGGAVTWGNGTTGTSGVIGIGNSVIGTSADDRMGFDWDRFNSGITPLSNGNYVLANPMWDNAGDVDVGAVRLMSGTGPTTGVLNASNSLIGSTAGDLVGENVRVVGGSRYIVGNPSWDSVSDADVGAMIWGNGITNATGFINASNALIGGTAGDRVGDFTGFYYEPVSVGGNKYVFGTLFWDNGAEVDVGALTLFDATTGLPTGVLSSTNSLVGTTAGDDIGNSYIMPLTNGNFVIGANLWDNGFIADAGAAMWVDSNVALTGEIDITRALVGTTAGDGVGFDIYALSNGNYVVLSSTWDDGFNTDVGAITWGDGTAGLTGAVGQANSVIGATANDLLGTSYLFETGGGYYSVISEYVTNGANAQAGGVTMLSINAPTSGYINSANTFFGQSANGGLTYDQYDLEEGKLVFRFSGDNRIFKLGGPTGGSLGAYDSYADFANSTITLDPNFITDVLNNGTAVTLQASNDITVNDAIIANNGGGAGGDLTLQAGRSILINADITTDDGNLNLYVNERLATGVVNAQRDAGNAVITMAPGVTLNAGAGDVNIRLDTGAGKTHRGAGDITLRDIIANTITAVNRNAGGDIVLESGTLDASGAGSSIVLSSLRNFINNAGAGALNVAPGSNWLVYSTRATQNIDGGLLSDYTLDGCTYAGSCPPLQADNAFLYSYDPNAPVVVTPAPSTPVAVVPPTVLYVSQTPWRAVYGMSEPMLDIGTVPMASLAVLDGSGFTDDWIWVEPEVKIWFGLDIDKI